MRRRVGAWVVVGLAVMMAAGVCRAQSEGWKDEWWIGWRGSGEWAER